MKTSLRGGIEMSLIDQLKLDDIKKKNTIVLTAFGISILAGFAVTILNKDYSQSIFYGTELVILLALYLSTKFLMKKDIYFPYVMVVVAYGFIIAAILINGGNVNSVVILFFLLFIATTHLIRPVFFNWFYCWIS